MRWESLVILTTPIILLATVILWTRWFWPSDDDGLT